MSSLTSLGEIVDVVIGVDTHVESHTAAVVDTATGGVVETLTVPATSAGYDELVAFAEDYSMLRAWAIEGTAGHGAGLTRLLASREEVVFELDRPERPHRRGGAKTDELDAARAAREALARTDLATPRETDGPRQELSVLLTARRSAVQAAGDATRQILNLLIAAPEQLRARFAGSTSEAIITRARRLRPAASWTPAARTTAETLKALANRVHALQAEAKTHERAILAIVRSWRPDLLAQTGVGPITAATVLCAWSHPGRIRSEAAFAKLAGASPIPANSGKTTGRYRLNRYGDRRLNAALHTIVITRLRQDQATRDYRDRRLAQGKTKREIRRCLKTYVARQLYRLLEHPPAQPA